MRRPRALLATLSAPLLLLAACPAALAQGAQPAPAPAAVSGRVTDGERGMPNVPVALTPVNAPSRNPSPLRARTGADGRYRIEGVPPGRYQVTPLSPAYVVKNLEQWMAGKALEVSAGESVENVDFTLERGAVITGRVTDADGNPVVNEPVRAVFADDAQQQRGLPLSVMGRPGDHMTDDRGVYRIYGLPAGRYRLSVGRGEATGFGFGVRRFYRLTYHPDVTDQAQARVVEVSAGGEATDVDIKVSTVEGTRRASGRVVSAETGRPVPGVSVIYGSVFRDASRVAPSGAGATTDERGEFRIENVPPGRYAASVRPREPADWYGDIITFEVGDSDVSGLEIRLRRGATVSGVAVIEGVADRAAAARMLGQVLLFPNVARAGGPVEMVGYIEPARVSPDGSFRLTGLGPGKLRIGATARELQQSLKLARVEVGGVAVTRDGIDLAEGAQVTGVRLVLTYGRGVIRGQVNYAGGELPQGARVMVLARPASSLGDASPTYNAEVDSRGRFSIQGLAAGEYELTVRAFGRGVVRAPTARQSVVVGDSGEASVTLTLNLGARPPQGETQ